MNWSLVVSNYYGGLISHMEKITGNSVHNNCKVS